MILNTNEREIIMKRNTVVNTMIFALTTMMSVVTVAGCGNSAADKANSPEESSEGFVIDESLASTPKTDTVATGDEIAEPPYFTKGVYANYAREAENPSKTYFYVFNTEDYGYTADGENDDIGLPFDITQEEGKVLFSFGGQDGAEDTLIITGAEGGFVYGYFEDIPERELVFELVDGAEADGFSAVNYLNAASGEDLVYNDANGWSVKYDPSCIEVSGGGPATFFVYTGECAGTSMITVTYDVDMDAEAKAQDLAKAYGEDATVTECIFPGTEDVEGFYVNANPEQMGPGLYESSFIREYMGGYLIFEFTTHVCGDDAIDIPVSDALASIIDSLSFE